MDQAQKTKDEGNESFKKEDYETAKTKYLNARNIAIKAAEKDYTLQEESKKFIGTLDNNISITYLKLKKYQLAIEHATKCLEQDAQNPKALLRRALAHKEIGYLKQAIEDIENAQKYDNNQQTQSELKICKEKLSSDPQLPVYEILSKGEKKKNEKLYEESLSFYKQAQEQLKKEQQTEKIQEMNKNIKRNITQLEIQIGSQNNQGKEEEIKIEEEETFFGSLDILQTIKTCQSQNGLKHNDYRRYRRYCGSKIKRIRKQLKFTFGKNKYLKKDVTTDLRNEPGLLQVLLFNSEKAWAYGMDLKQNYANRTEKESKRVKHHCYKKLKKALQWSMVLQKVCQTKTEEKTQLESQAYSSYLSGLYNYEKENWDTSLLSFIKSRQIYTDLIKVSDSLQGVFYKEKIDHLDQSIRYSYQQNGGSMMDSVEKILSQYKEGNIEITKTEFKTDNQINILEVEFHGDKFPIKNEKLILLIKNIEKTQFELKERFTKQIDAMIDENVDEQEEILSLYIEMFSYFDDAIAIIIKEKEDPKTNEGEKEIYTKIQNYFTQNKYIQQQKRNYLLVKTAITKFDKEDGINNLDFLTSKKAYKQKLTRPTEIIKLTDNLGQTFKNLMEIERMSSDLEQYKRLDALDIFYKAIRCYYMCCMYFSVSKYIEVISLLDHCEHTLQTGTKKIQEFKLGYSNFDELIQESNDFIQKIAFLKVKTKIAYLDKQNFENESITDKVQKLNVEGRIHNKSIEKLSFEAEQGLKPFFSLDKLSNNTIIDIPPKPELSTCKPLFFDIAYSYLNYPDLKNKIKEEKKGWFGLGSLNPWSKK